MAPTVAIAIWFARLSQYDDGEEREDDEREDREETEPNPLHGPRPEPHVGLVAGVEDAALEAHRHSYVARGIPAPVALAALPRIAHTRSMISFPNSPYGRTIRTRISTM